MKKLTFDKALYSLNRRIKKYILKNKINIREIDKGSNVAGYCLITKVDKEIVVNNNQSIYIKPFVILHEIGHYLDEDYINSKGIGVIKNREFEKKADNFIYHFCIKYCSLAELFTLKTIIENTSKMSISFSMFEKFRIRLLGIIGVL